MGRRVAVVARFGIALCILLGAGELFVFPWPASAQEAECSDCQDGLPAFSEAVAFLGDRGYPSEQYTVLLTWNEVSRLGKRVLVTGYRLEPVEGGSAFDVYFDKGGNLLSQQQLAAMGIAPKDWHLAPAERQAELPQPEARVLASTPRPMALPKALGVVASVGLPAVDLDRVRAEDEAGLSSPAKGVRRTGFFVDLPEPIGVMGVTASQGVWRLGPDGGSVWTAILHSAGAVAQRIHFSALSLPAGARVLVYNANAPSEAYGPFVGLPEGETDLWSPSCFSEDVGVECYVPAGVDLSGVELAIDRTVHVYTKLEDLPWAKAAGTCNLDVACYPEWQETSTGVGGIGTIGSTGSLWCTGTLVVDSDPKTSTPYFLTANHCVGSQAKASTMEVYWLYQTVSCGGIAPEPGSVPRTTGGADYLAGISNTAGTDFTLVRLRNQPPDSLQFVGWSSSAVAAGTDVADIHHPRGDFKRIAFGVTQPPGVGDLKPSEFFHKIIWSDGTTEPGSSGSPLLLLSHQIVGQLYGGYASCSTPDEADYFGRFDVSFAVLKDWLGGGGGPADVNKSGSVDSVDVQLVINAALGLSIPPEYNADVDHSGVVDAVDIQLVINAALHV